MGGGGGIQKSAVLLTVKFELSQIHETLGILRIVLLFSLIV